MRFPVSSAQLNAAPPAIVEQAKDWRYYEQAILHSEEHTGKLYREYKEGGAWKSQYKTWEAACVPLGKSRSQVDRLIKEIVVISDNRAKCAESTDTQDKKEQKALSQVEQAREEEPEKPAVHSADEKPREEAKPQNNGHVKSAKPPMDVSGCVIPQRLLAIRERRQELQDAAHWASKLKCLFEGLQTQDDVLFRHLKASGNLQTFMNGAATMHYTISKCLPDVVCPECGAKSDSCQYCFGSGWISEVTWNREWVKSNDRLKGAEVAKRAKNL